ncbi:permease [Pseudoalteromonas sp. NBT06-2]|uniref:sulfite exporter TauE/SafE family protein n=1 Tax=Pseudoalteromonas sp. NBT06-2 TaxID=2025950 RepID=UPI000BA7E12D|nr:sulfite exporter TauE/SafE family protein [Pseudoalteromonas sp. NBT06-2]PAJ73786.1 permease [Pseudoalteromonas sp. NBT06-2]
MQLKNIQNTSQTKYIPFCFFILVYGFWFYGQGPTEALINLSEQFHIALTMVFGSFVAGGTALGGGAIAFPVMTKILLIEPETAKIFSLAIQSFGMTAAALTIIYGGIRYYKNVVLLALIGAIPGIIISLSFIVELIPRLAVKSLFSLLIFCFAITLLKLHFSKKIIKNTDYWLKVYWIPLVGFIGGITSGLIGSGADIAIFALLVLFYKKDLKASTATSVIIMAVTSIIASFYNFYYLETFTAKINAYVLAAVPVVVIGAPLGAYVCSKVQPNILMTFLLLLIALEVVVTLFEILN